MRTSSTPLGVAAAIVLLALVTSPAQAVINGSADGDANPNVAFLVTYSDGARHACTGTLVSPTVLLTAGHCATGISGRTAVSFDSSIGDDSSRLPQASNTAAGYSSADLRGTGYLSGSSIAHPDFTGDLKDYNDVGVVVLDTPVRTIRPAKLAPTNYLDTLNARDSAFTSIGFGAWQESSSPNETPSTYPIIRRSATVPGKKITKQELQLDGKKANQGPCYGDSGGPAIIDGYLVGVDSWVLKTNCDSTAGYARADLPSIKQWLVTYGVTPS